MRHEFTLGALLATAMWATIAVFLPASSVPFLWGLAAPTAAVLAAALVAAWAAYRVGHARALVAKAGAMTTGEAIARFETRSQYLMLQAWLFLLLVLVLLAAGAAAVWFAPNITASDIGSTSYERKMAAIKAAREKADERYQELINDPARDTCREAIASALQSWKIEPSTAVFNVGLSEVEFPTADALIRTLRLAFARLDARSGDPAIDIGLRVPACNTRKGAAYFFFRVPRDKVGEIENAMRRAAVPASLSPIMAEVESLRERSIQLGQLTNQVGLERLQSEVGGLKEQPATTSTTGKDDLFLRLLQTSITRFGLLAVVGFFVSILVSLYRYNVRLAAFYMARADVLRLYAPNVTISDFALLATVLSPTLEFGKAPQPPLGQLIEMAKTVKEAGK